MPPRIEMPVEQGVAALLRSLYPGARSVTLEPLLVDSSGHGETAKAIGYGDPIRVHIRDARNRDHDLVLHTPTANDFGHDRRADRAQEALLAFDTFRTIPASVEAVDVGAIAVDGSLVSLRDAGEFYLLTRYVDGKVYADDLRRLGAGGPLGEQDLGRVEALARYLGELHQQRVERPAAYRRAIRDLLGHGECIFGLVDNYPDDTPSAPPARLQSIEQLCLDWRWRLRGRADRLRRTHGDFHPFNILFGGGVSFTLLDTSRGALGDPADDVAALAINFPFFALEQPASWSAGLGVLWHRFFEVYLEVSRDREVLEVIAPFLAFRGLVLANPRFYPRLTAEDRDRILGFVERALSAARFDPHSVDALFGRGERASAPPPMQLST